MADDFDLTLLTEEEQRWWKATEPGNLDRLTGREVGMCLRNALAEIMRLRGQDRTSGYDRVWRITVPGYEYNPNGADYHPDDTEEFVGSEAELRAHILAKETAYQIARQLYVRAGKRRFTRAGYAGRTGIPNEVWALVQPKGEAGACEEWCREVVEVLRPESTAYGFDRFAVIAQAKAVAEDLATARIQAAEATLAERQRKQEEQAAAAEIAELARLRAKYPGA